LTTNKFNCHRGKKQQQNYVNIVYVHLKPPKS